MILSFLPCFSPRLLALKAPIHIVSFKFENDVPFVVSGGIRHVARLLATPSHGLTVKFCVKGEVPEISALAMTDPTKASEYGTDIARTLALLFQMMQAAIGWKEKKDFLQYFMEREGKGAKKSQ